MWRFTPDEGTWVMVNSPSIELPDFGYQAVWWGAWPFVYFFGGISKSMLSLFLLIPPPLPPLHPLPSLPLFPVLLLFLSPFPVRLFRAWSLALRLASFGRMAGDLSIQRRTKPLYTFFLLIPFSFIFFTLFLLFLFSF